MLTFAAAVGFVTSSTVPTEGTPITPGNLIIYRVGDGVSALGTTATAVFLDEYTVAGTLVQSIPLPTTGPTSLTAVGNATTEGIITTSQDGTNLVFTGYRKDVGGTNPSSDAPATTNRIIASVGLSGVVNTTSVALTDTTGTIRSATTADGSFYYLATSAAVRYVPSPGPAATSVSIDARNSREVLLAGNTLYASNGSTAITAKVQSYGTLPTSTTTPTPIVTLASSAAVNGFSLFDLSPLVAGVDTLYALSTVDNLLYKYSFDGSLWNQNGSLSAGSAQNMTGFVSGGSVNLFLTSSGSLLPYVDTSGYNNFDSGITLGTALASASTNTAFRGIGVAVPEPTTGTLLGFVAALGFGMRRNRRQLNPEN